MYALTALITGFVLGTLLWLFIRNVYAPWAIRRFNRKYR